MKITIIGLGLIGGSLAKALTRAGHAVLGRDINPRVIEAATSCGAIKAVASDVDISSSAAVILAVNADKIVPIMRDLAERGVISPDTLILDICGVKRQICEQGFSLAQKHGFIFVGGHPMAGREVDGFSNSAADLFKGASMILVPPRGVPPRGLDSIITDALTNLFEEIGFAKTVITDAATHDRIIAYTSQLAHVVSSAYSKSPTASEHEGFSAGSYRDLTRVAPMNAPMWAELFTQNADNLIAEIDRMIENLTKYKTAVASGAEATAIVIGEKDK